MPILLNPPNSSAIEEYLKAVLPHAAFRSLEIKGGQQPLLIVQNQNVVSCFSFSDHRISQNYEIAYSSFKRYYLQFEQDLQSVDLAFVFCVPPDVPELDRFSSRVETDVFFCRKFVVPVMEPFGFAFARPPFLPLAPIDGPSLRPVSAQTFLQRAGVPANLARHLVVQQERSAERIVEDCLAGHYGKPQHTLLVNALPNLVDSYAVRAPVHLSTITIENFRAYRKSQTFNFGEDLTVLYGPNGFGKTSFFDAIDFAATGGIGRLRSTGDARFEKAATHLDSVPSQSSVSRPVVSTSSTMPVLVA